MMGRKLSTILAGYPWFGDWGRDTFIALPGLLLTTGRLGAARDVLRAFAGVLRNGLVPNRFEDYGDEAQYNTVDASLWFVHAGLAYAAAAGTRPAWLRDAMVAVLDAYAAGTEAHDHEGRPVRIDPRRARPRSRTTSPSFSSASAVGLPQPSEASTASSGINSV